MRSLIPLARPSKVVQVSLGLLRNLPLQPRQLRRQRTTKAKAPIKTYNTPHPPKDPPENYQPTSVDHNAFTAPPFLPCAIFRPFCSPDEPLGPAASKCGQYKNPEYYAYHRYTFVELQRNTLELRQQRICDDNATVVYDCESEVEEGEAVENMRGVEKGEDDEGSSNSSSGSSSSDDEKSCPNADNKENEKESKGESKEKIKEAPSDEKPTDILL